MVRSDRLADRLTHTDRLADRLGTAAAISLIDGVLLVGFAVALVVCYAMGLGLAWALAVAVVSFGIEYATTGVAARGVLGAESVTDPPAGVRSTVDELAAEMGIDPPHVVVDRDVEGITVLDGRDSPVVIVGDSVLADLDGGSLRSVLAHELAHVARGHFGRMTARNGVTHVVGVSVFWVVALQHLAVPLAAVAGGAYLVAGVTRTNGLDTLYYLVASLGVVLVPLALSARAARLEECRADDVAVEHSSAMAFCVGLYITGPLEPTGGLSPDGPSTADASTGRASPIERFTAVYPSVEYRLTRQGITPEDVIERAERRSDRSVVE